MRTTLSRGLLALAVVGMAACSDVPTAPGGGGDLLSDASAESLAASFDAMSADAAMVGDDHAAGDFADGALALRLGARPTEIAVTVRGQGYRYFAVVTGVITRSASGAELLRRTVVAWHGLDRPDAVLRLTSLADAGSFGGNGASTDIGRASGTWAALAQGLRFSAEEGFVNTTLGSIGAVCPNGQDDPRFSCNLARFGMRLEGVFVQSGDPAARVIIASTAENIAGVVVRRTAVTSDRNGSTGGR